jgi:hypothetical protein
MAKTYRVTLEIEVAEGQEKALADDLYSSLEREPTEEEILKALEDLAVESLSTNGLPISVRSVRA